MYYYEGQLVKRHYGQAHEMGDYSILVTECLVVHESVLMAMKIGVLRIFIQRDSQLVVNSIN